MSNDQTIDEGRLGVSDEEWALTLTEPTRDNLLGMASETTGTPSLAEAVAPIANTTPSTDLPDVREVDVDAIVMPAGRERPSQEIEAIAASIQQTGLIHPIVVTSNMVLVVGAGRLGAMRLLGRKTILARVVELSELEAKLVELDENLMRRELTVLERSEQIVERKRIYEALPPEAKVGGAPGRAGGGKRAKSPGSGSFVRDTVVKTGRGRSTVHEEVQIGNITRPVRDLLRNTPIVDKKCKLLSIARLPADEQMAAAERAVRGEVRRAAPHVPNASSTDKVANGARATALKAVAEMAPADEAPPSEEPVEQVPTWETVMHMLFDVRPVLEKLATEWHDDPASRIGTEALRRSLDDLVKQVLRAVETRATWVKYMKPASAPSTFNELSRRGGNEEFEGGAAPVANVELHPLNCST